MKINSLIVAVFILCASYTNAQLDLSVFLNKKEMMALRGNYLNTAFDYLSSKPQIKCVSGDCNNGRGALKVIVGGNNNILILGNFKDKKINGEAIVYALGFFSKHYPLKEKFPLKDFEQQLSLSEILEKTIKTPEPLFDTGFENDFAEVLYGDFNDNVINKGDYYFFSKEDADQDNRKCSPYPYYRYITKRALVIPFRFLQLVEDKLLEKPNIAYHFKGDFSKTTVEVEQFYSGFNKTRNLTQFTLASPSDFIEITINKSYKTTIKPTTQSKQFSIIETNLNNSTTDQYLYFEQDRYYNVYGPIGEKEIEGKIAQQAQELKRKREEKAQKTKEVLASTNLRPGMIVTDNIRNYYVSKLYTSGCLGLNSLPFPNNQNYEYFKYTKYTNVHNDPLLAPVYYDGDISYCDLNKFQEIQNAAICHVCNGNGNYYGYKDKNVSYTSEKTTYKTLHKGDYYEVTERVTTATTTTGTVQEKVLLKCNTCQGYGALIIDESQDNTSNSSSNSNYNWKETSSSKNSSSYTVPTKIQNEVRELLNGCNNEYECMVSKFDPWFDKQAEQKSSLTEKHQLAADVTKALYNINTDWPFHILWKTNSKYLDYYGDIKETDLMPREIFEKVRGW